jgi:hypothetical protein
MIDRALPSMSAFTTMTAATGVFIPTFLRLDREAAKAEASLVQHV